MNASIVQAIKQEAKTYFVDAKGSHGWDHVERVHNLCMQIGEIENADLYILEISAYLHDIARGVDMDSKGKICHAELGAKMATGLLDKYAIGQDYTSQITHCIETHRYRNSKTPESIEAKVLFDSDKLDSTGAVGIGRLFYFANEIKAILHIPDLKIEDIKEYSKDDCAYREFLYKSKHIEDRMLTAEGKRMAHGRIKMMKDFFDTMNLEYSGKI